MNYLKQIIKETCGPRRNMTTFAKDISEDVKMSTSSLYRLAAGDFRTPVSDEVVEAIIKHADEGSSITKEDLRRAFDTVYWNKQTNVKARTFNMVRNNEMWAETTGRRIILDVAAASEATLKSNHQTLADRKHEGLFFDFSLNVEMGEIRQKANFDFISTPMTIGVIEQRIGRYMRLIDYRNEYFYLVSVLRVNSRDNQREDLKKQLKGLKLPIGLSLVWIEISNNGECSIEELSIGDEKGILTFDMNF